MQKLWGGRFTKSTDSFTDHFHSSIGFDSRMYHEDITGSMAHAAMLGKQGIIPQEDADLIVKTLGEILEDIEAGKVTFDEKAEDIHMNMETILISRIGDVGKKLHTGRSRNDQVALDTRMYTKKEITEIKSLVKNLLVELNTLAEAHTEPSCPAIPISSVHSLSHWRIICWLMWKCSSGTMTASVTLTNGQTYCLWAAAHWLLPHIL